MVALSAESVDRSPPIRITTPPPARNWLAAVTSAVSFSCPR